MRANSYTSTETWRCHWSIEANGDIIATRVDWVPKRFVKPAPKTSVTLVEPITPAPSTSRIQ